MILDRIVTDRRIQLENEKRELSLDSLMNSIDRNALSQDISFYRSLKDYIGMSIIAEIKKASPSKGLINNNFDAVSIAMQYENSEIQAVSILTEEKHFQGSNEYLRAARAVLTKPILRKDFIIDSYQIYHACYLGANAILLIASILTDNELKNFLAIAERLSMQCLVEVHNESELDRVLSIGVRIIGINNRDLKTFKVDLGTTEKLIQKIPSNVITISESGIENSDDIEYLKSVGVKGVLIGEAFMRCNNINETAKSLRGIV